MKRLDLAQLDRAMTFAHEGHRFTLLAYALTRTGDALDTQAAHEALEQGTDNIANCVRTLKDLGGDVHTYRKAEPIPLDRLNTPDVRALLDGLRGLVPLADRIDEARGRSLDEAFPGDVKGLDLADALHSLVLRLEGEVCGPKGKD